MLTNLFAFYTLNTRIAEIPTLSNCRIWGAALGDDDVNLCVYVKG